MWLEKPEPLLESGHDLAVTHERGREGDRGRERGDSSSSPDAEKQAGALSPRRPDRCLSLLCGSLHPEPRLLFIRAPAVFTGGDVVQGLTPPPPPNSALPPLTVNIRLVKVNGEITACMNDVLKL
ncbi:hypothetical protein PBY51_022329 [Eleginops maclovinus]|uniref:Uncharacterized protein n=1 Tax=Eleginops maclovinus TaxID=56733 RepID=A0AAN7XCU0_ELEMC|nr:hypothetical protein PBY51_022329 [Eleginops maclovinus]